ncbi:Alpha/Beta hydrolase protein [Chaetomium tenue]|uniref:Alpha/Beta hydrolase protein n=1 Tax=Chaetomium tenue TaxID=1854479 RepID=A0ACB7PMJ4_9PEZI|nr:Alpha/Beta hydrolase protein [Chaetomium globosum]
MPTKTKTITVQSGVDINVVISDAPVQGLNPTTIIFLHYWGGSARTWSLVTPLVSALYTTVAIDFRGWGASTGPEEPDAYSISALAEDVEDVIAALHIRRVILVGLSMGAKVSQLVAARMCSQASDSKKAGVLQGLVLVSPAPPTPLMLPPDMRELQLHAYDNIESASFVARRVLTRSFEFRDPPSFLVADMLRGNQWARKAWPAYAMAEDVSGVINNISLPVLILAGENDVVETLERVKLEVCSRFPGAILEVLHGSGHLSPLEVPEVVANRLLTFLNGLEAHTILVSNP